MAAKSSKALFRYFSSIPPCFNSSTAATVGIAGGEITITEEDETTISTAVSIIRSQKNKSRWRFLHAHRHSTVFSPLQSAEIIRRLRNNPHLALRFFNSSLCSSTHLLPSVAAAFVLARSRNRSSTLSVLLSATRIDSSPLDLFEILVKYYRAFDSAPFIFDILIIAYIRSHNLDRALEITRLLKSRNICVQISTGNEIITAVSRSRGSLAAIEIYKQLGISPKVSTFNVLLHAIYRDGCYLERVNEIRSEMERFNCLPNLFTYNIMIAANCDEGLIDEAENLFDEVEKKGIGPDAITFNTMIDGYSNAGEIEKAEEFYRKMELRGIEPTSNTFEFLIRGHCRVGRLDSAFVLLRDMRRRGFEPDTETVDEVLDEMSKKSRAEEGLQMLREAMRRDDSFSPSKRSYETLIRGFCDEGELEEAAKLQAEMAGKGFSAGLNVYQAFIMGYRKIGNVEMAEKLEDEMLKMADDAPYGDKFHAESS